MRGLITSLPTSAWFHSLPVSLLTQAPSHGTQYWRRTPKWGENTKSLSCCCLPSCCISLFLSLATHCESGWGVQPPSLGSTVWSHTANNFFLRSWTTCKGWFRMLNLGRVFFIIPKRRGIFIIIGKLSSLLMGGERGIGCPCGNGKHHWQPVTNEYAQHLQLTCFACLGSHASKLAVWKFQWPTAVIPGVLLQVFFSELFFILEWSYLPPLILCFPGSLAPGLNKSLFHQCKAGPWAPLHHALLLLHSSGSWQDTALSLWKEVKGFVLHSGYACCESEIYQGILWRQYSSHMAFTSNKKCLQAK